jgi:hypothetical protein
VDRADWIRRCSDPALPHLGQVKEIGEAVHDRSEIVEHERRVDLASHDNTHENSISHGVVDQERHASSVWPGLVSHGELVVDPRQGACDLHPTRISRSWLWPFRLWGSQSVSPREHPQITRSIQLTAEMSD